MIARVPWVAAAAAAMLALAQDGPAPPAIAQWGIDNFASRISPQLPSGAVAPGSLIRIRGWRLGPAPLDQVVIRIRQGETRVESSALAVNENEIETRVPQNAPLGDAMLQVVKNGQASLEWPVAIVESSFGAFSRNGLGWGPGEISNADGSPNTEALAAKPGGAVTLAGTGLGSPAPRRASPQVLVAGRPATNVRVLGPSAARPGVDTIAFHLPADTPEGCHVPVQVSSAPGLYGNAVTLAVSRGGRACADRTGWTAGFESRTVRLATVALIHADLEIGVTPKDTALYPVDAGLASFSEIEPNAALNPLFLFPPVNTCTTYSGTVGLHSITSPLAALQALPGKALDAGPRVTVRGSSGEQSLPGTDPRSSYWHVIGGHPPVPGMKDLPLFLAPGDYQVSAPGGADVGAFQTSLRIAPPLTWQNREQLGEVDRAHGATVAWQSSAKSAIVMVVAMNVDSRSGALGVCACLASAAAGSFGIPAYALANFPPTPEHPRGFPLNLMLLLELPEAPVTSAKAQGLDRAIAFAISVSARTVRYK
jgi:uncharacterized protein (TIGR03437 family)